MRGWHSRSPPTSNSEILIVDEVLSVGDTEFQKKCLDKISGMTMSGRTVFFVSHNLASVASLCTRCLLLKTGRLIVDGLPATAIAKYAETGGRSADGEIILGRPAGDPGAYFSRAALKTSDGEVGARIGMGEPAALEIEYVIEHPQRDMIIAIVLYRNGTPVVASFDTDMQEELLERREPGSYRAHLDLPLALFKEGNYTIELQIRADKQWQSDPAALSFEICNYREDSNSSKLSLRVSRPMRDRYPLEHDEVVIGSEDVTSGSAGDGGAAAGGITAVGRHA